MTSFPGFFQRDIWNERIANFYLSNCNNFNNYNSYLLTLVLCYLCLSSCHMKKDQRILKYNFNVNSSSQPTVMKQSTKNWSDIFFMFFFIQSRESGNKFNNTTGQITKSITRNQEDLRFEVGGIKHSWSDSRRWKEVFYKILMLKLHKIFPEEVRCNTCMKGTTETFFEGNWVDDEKALI